MEITDVKLRKVDSDGRMKAIVSITLDGEFAVHDLRVIEGNSGLFVAMPSKKNSSGEFKDVAHPISKLLRDKITVSVLREYGYSKEDYNVRSIN